LLLTDRTVRISLLVKIREDTRVSAVPSAVGDRVTDILDAASRVVRRDGAHGLRMAAVASEAGVSKALVHYYFPTRQDLLRAAFASSGEQWNDAIARELDRARDGVERVERFLLASVDTAAPYGEHRALWNEVWSSLRVDEELRPLVRDVYRRWVRRLQELVEEALAEDNDAGNTDGSSAAWRLAAVVDGLDSMLYLGLVSRSRARKLVRQSVEQELGRR
jgi:AcrR family transcriptional regulator